MSNQNTSPLKKNMYTIMLLTARTTTKTQHTTEKIKPKRPKKLVRYIRGTL